MKKLYTLVVCLVVLGLVLGSLGCAKKAPAPAPAPAPGPPPGPPGEVIELTCAHELTPTSGKGRAIEEWAKSVEAATGGRIKITIYPASSLVAPPDQYPSLLQGVIDITQIPCHVVPELALEAVYNLPMLPSDFQTVQCY